MSILRLSSASCGCDSRLVFSQAKRYGIEYVEIVPFKKETARRLCRYQAMYGVKIGSIHGAMWMPNMYRYLVKNDPVKKYETMVARWLSGTLLENPGLRIARNLEVPIVLHSGIWFEMLQNPLQGLSPSRLFLSGCELSWEAASYPHPWASGGAEGLEATIDAYDACRRRQISSSITLDNAHLARVLRGITPEQALEKAAEVIGRRRVFQVHFSDVRLADNYYRDINHLPLGSGDIDVAESLRLIRQLWPDAFITIEVLGRWDWILKNRSKAPLEQSIRAVQDLL